MYAITQSLPGEDSIAGIPWTQIAQRVGSRSERQCRKKWLSYSTTKRVETLGWSDEDELYLLQRYTVFDLHIFQKLVKITTFYRLCKD